MKKVRIFLLAALAVSLFVSVDFGINFFRSLVPALNDGIGCASWILTAVGAFDGGWTQARFYEIFAGSLWITFGIAALNIILAIWQRMKD